MSESELAARLQAEKDDLSQWEEVPPRPRPDKRKLSAMVSVRLSPEELERLQERAGESGQSVSAYLRSLALRDASRGSLRRAYGNKIIRTEGASNELVVVVSDSVTRVSSSYKGPRRPTRSAGRITTSAEFSQGASGRVD